MCRKQNLTMWIFSHLKEGIDYGLLEIRVLRSLRFFHSIYNICVTIKVFLTTRPKKTE